MTLRYFDTPDRYGWYILKDDYWVFAGYEKAEAKQVLSQLKKDDYDCY